MESVERERLKQVCVTGSLGVDHDRYQPGTLVEAVRDFGQQRQDAQHVLRRGLLPPYSRQEVFWERRRMRRDR